MLDDKVRATIYKLQEQNRVWLIVENYKKNTRRHRQLPNQLPKISISCVQFERGKLIWQFKMTCDLWKKNNHRLLFASQMRKKYKSILFLSYVKHDTKFEFLFLLLLFSLNLFSLFYFQTIAVYVQQQQKSNSNSNSKYLSNFRFKSGTRFPIILLSFLCLCR